MRQTIINLYRVRDWIKTFGIVIIGFVIGKIFLNPLLLLVGVLQSICLFAFLYIVDDFNDSFVEKRKKFIGRLIQKKIIDIKTGFTLVLLPFIISFIIAISSFSKIYFVVYLLYLFFAVTYSISKLRMGDRPFFDVIFNVVFFSLIFVLSVIFAGRSFTETALFILIWFAFYIFSQELIHQIAHYSIDTKSTAKFLGKPETIKLLQISFLLSALAGVFLFYQFANLRIFATVMILFSLVRFVFSVKFSSKTNFEFLRDRIGGLIEAFIYFILLLI